MKAVNLLTLLPLFSFILVARLHGMTDLAWKEAFLISGFISIVVVGIQLYAEAMIDRLMLGVNLFLTMGALSFLGDIGLLLYFYGAYKGVVFLSCIAIIGVITTFFSNFGFVGVKSQNKKLLFEASLQLLAINIAGIAWSFVMNNDGLVVAVVIPFVVLRVMYERLGKEVVKAERALSRS